MAGKEHPATTRRFRLHPGFAPIGAPGANAAALAGLTALIGAGRAIAISASPALRVEAMPGDLPLISCQTSGSTGAPKRILREHASWTRSFDANGRAFGLTPADRYAILGSLASSLCTYAAIEAMHLGVPLADLSGAAPTAQLRALGDLGISVLYCSPAQLRLLLRAGATPLPALRHVLCGGGKLDTPTRQALAAQAPAATIREFYGAAETSFIAISDADTPEGAVGRAYPGVEIQIRNATSGIGEIWVRSPYLFLRYAEGAAPDTHWQDGFLTVGELGRLDGRGYLHLTGRAGRMVTVADQNVFPEAIEQHLLSLPGIRQCAVLPLPDPLRGQHLVAVIEGAGDEARAQIIRQSCRARLGAASVPRRVIFQPELPMLASGKPDLALLAATLGSGA